MTAPVWLGPLLILMGGGWLVWMSRRARKRRSAPQAAIDFATGAPRESVLAVGLLLLGVIAVLARLFAAP